MNTRYSLRNLFAARSARTPRKPSQRTLLTLEGLEDRRLLSTFTVTSTLDTLKNSLPTQGTLRWAIGQANSAGGTETIVFDSSVFKAPQTIHLSGTQLELSDTTGTETIVGPKKGVTVSGQGLSRVFQVDDGVTASISGLTITDGKTATNGGGLYNDGGNVTLINCTISGNSAGHDAGGLYANGGTTTLTDSTVSCNSAAYGVGGLKISSGTTTLTDSTVSGNSAVAGVGGHRLPRMLAPDTLIGCTISGNTTPGLLAACSSYPARLL